MPYACALAWAEVTRWTGTAFQTPVRIDVYDATGWGTDANGNPVPPSPLPDPLTTATFEVAGNPSDADLSTQAIAAAQQALAIVLAPLRFSQRQIAWTGRYLAVPDPP